MKLLCVIPGYWPAFRFGGPIYSVHGLNKALVKKGIDLTVYTTNVGLNGKVPVNQEVNIDGVKINYFAFSKFFEFLGATGWQFSWPTTKALRKNLKTFDLIHLHAIWNYPTAAAAYYCRQYKKPYIIAPRGALYPYTIGKNAWKKWPYYKLVAKRDVEGATTVHYTAEDEAERCHSFLALKNQAIIIPNGINISELNDLPLKESLKERYPILKEKTVILFLSRINWIKGLDILVKAFAMLAKERKDTHLLIVGDDDGDGYENKVKGWIREYGLNYWDYGLGHKGLEKNKDIKVTFTGALNGREKFEAFAGSDLFVLPSYSENFGMAVVEAMACGIPVVISNKVGIYKEVEKNNAGIIVETNPESLLKGIKTILDNEKRKKEIAENGERLVKEYYDINKVADMMIKVYEEILKCSTNM
jgi:glycosyltransferase involved in cell wall biosynthesis